MPTFEILIDNKPRRVELTKNGDGSFTAKIGDKSRKIELDNVEVGEGDPFMLRLDGKTYKVQIPKIERDRIFSVTVDRAIFQVQFQAPAKKQVLRPFQTVVSAPSKRPAANKQTSEGSVTAPMTGKIVSVRVKKGDTVKEKQVLCIIEAMKMENEITSSRAGMVKEVFVSEGLPVGEGDVLLVIG
jgi:biotin carboxyl carrier protein